jgi:hypothetical protein
MEVREMEQMEKTSSQKLADFARMQSEIASLKAQLAAKPKAKAGKPIFKVAAKKGVSVYGLQRWPTTLYAGQWLALLDAADEMRAFIETHTRPSSSGSTRNRDGGCLSGHLR